ncbi:UDP-glycosyltransferase 72B1 [Dichanthelium oligosanthes]|uniref:Glycosyltransferase n=1 Tax=Dichanthelium oligosanthes TaxID=888268 RepID=A0A1E5VAZ9_9POAL|nr:UDP-glycosyltransferase 72B1 [Dichanthelium oligosanthes]
MCGGETKATAAAPSGPPPHVALLSSPGMGHVAPLAELARRLHDAHGFTATVLTYASSDSAAQRAFLASLPPAVGAASLPAVPLGDLPAGAAIETLLSVEAQRSVPALTAVLSGLKSTTNLVAFVADLFGADTLRAARDAGVPGYLFFPSNLLMLSLMLHLPRLDANVAGEFRDLPEPVRLPGCVPVPGADILQPLQDRASDAYRWMVHQGERYRDAAGILVNTFDAVEPGAAAVLRQPEPWRPPVYPIGPLTRQPTDDGGSGAVDATSCIDWLDAQPDRSVLFVSFGSGGALSTAQTGELARGLELSGHRFLWVVRSPTDGGANPGESYYDRSSSKDDPLSFLPPGFVERTKELGRVVPSWAPQTRVLAHRATKAMLTHCGWNSALESMAAGVPMIAWPLYAEQRENAVMLCEETKVALRPKVRDANDMILADDIAEVVKEMMGGEKGEAACVKVMELQEAARSGLEPGGMSGDTLAQVVSKWTAVTC